MDWSRKDAPTAPHLSTIDALVLAVRLAEIHLGHTFQLDRDQRRRMWLKRIDIRAGGAPTEDGLDAIDVSGTLKHTAAGLVCERQSVFDARVASMSVRCVIEHDVGAVPALPAADGVFPLAADAQAADEIRPYGTGFMTRHPQLTDVSVDPDLTRAQATCPSRTPADHGRDAGAGGGPLALGDDCGRFRCRPATGPDPALRTRRGAPGR